jgi:hypothetical protein
LRPVRGPRESQGAAAACLDIVSDREQRRCHLSGELSMKKAFAGLAAFGLYAALCALPANVSADDKPKPTPEERFKRLDKNSDMKLSFDEFKGKQTDEEKLKTAKANFERKDADKDGSLTLEEYKAGAKKPKA